MLTLVFVFLCFSVILSVYAAQNWEIFSRDSVFFADEDVIIKGPSIYHLELLQVNDGEVMTDDFLPNNVERVTVNVNGIELTFAKGVERFYNVPLENSPLLYNVNGQNLTVADDHLYRIDMNTHRAYQLTSDHYQGKHKTELALLGNLHWVSNLQIDHERNTFYYVSNRRSLSEEGNDAQIDLWKIDLATGNEELVVQNSNMFLGEKDDYIIASTIHKDQFNIQLVNKQDSSTIVDGVEMVLGRDKFHFFYFKDNAVYKYDINNNHSEEIIDATAFSFSGVTSSLNEERSFIIATNIKTGHEVLYVTDNIGTNLIDAPQGLNIANISWINNNNVLFSGYLNNDESNVITYKISFDNK